jgi:GT2 family glycosyltransferase
MEAPPLRLSVVIPTCQTRELTLRCLESLAAERAAPEGAVGDFEVVVVDDGSRDGTSAAIRERFPAVRLVVNEEAQGFSRAANRGLAAARGEVLFLLNSDTEVAPGGLEQLAAIFDSDPRLGIAGAQLSYPDGTPQWSGGAAPTLLWLFVLSSGLGPLLGRLRPYRRLRPLAHLSPHTVAWVTGAALALRRAAWEAVGPLDTDFRFYAQDLDLCLRAGRAGWRIELRPEVRVLHHHGASVSRSAGSFRRQNHALLWGDLLRWARKDRGEAWGRRAAAALRWGARLRLMGRALAQPFLSSPRRAAWKEESALLRRALEDLPLAFAAPGR